MNSLSQSLLLAALVSAKTLGITLWIGLGMLTISLLVLMRTRWGQARPLSKCLVLSIFAHILLAGYAYGTRLIFDAPPPGGDDVIRLTLQPIGDDGEELAVTRQPARPWEQLTTEDAVAPNVEPQQRRETTESAPLERHSEANWRDDSQLPADAAAPLFEPERPAPTPQSPAPMRVASANPTAAPIDTPEVRKPAAPQPEIVPESPPLERRQPEIADAAPSAQNEADLPSELIEETSQLQRLADAMQAETANALASSTDSLQEAANKDAGQLEASGAVGDQDAQAQAATPVSTGIDSAAKDSTAQPPAASQDSAEPLRLGDGQPLPALYQRRIGQARFRMLERYGGSARAQEAVEAALAWLAANQSEDGRWDAAALGGGRETRALGAQLERPGIKADTGITGLALLAFLGDGHTHLEGKYRKNVQHGLEFLLRSQAEDGHLAGEASTFAMMYCHGMAMLALSEAFAMSGDRRIEPFLQKAVQYTIAAQHPTDGGWRYQPGDRGDMSQFGWQVMALRSAQEGGIEIPASTRSGMRRFLSSVSSGRYGGLASYRTGEAPSRSMTAEALACRVFLDAAGDGAQIDEAVIYVLQEMPRDGRPNLYYWYYASLALFQVQGDEWRVWSGALQQQLLSRQRQDGANAGSWDPDTQWGPHGGRAYSTAMGALCLEVYYRYLPLYETARLDRRPPAR